MASIDEFFDVSDFEHASLFLEARFVWDPLARLNDYLADILREYRPVDEGDLALAEISGSVHIAASATVMSGAYIKGPVHIGPGTRIESGAYIEGPTYIGADCEIRHVAYVRPGTLLGDRCVVGHATEIKHSIMLDGSQAPHFCYVGDCILGARVNLGAGTKLANLPLNSQRDPATRKRPSVRVRLGGELLDSGLAKFGAILGDDTMTGCNAVTNPACLMGRGCHVHPNVTVRSGYHEPGSVVRLGRSKSAASRAGG